MLIKHELAWYNLKSLGDFINDKSSLFEVKDLYELLKISLKGHRCNSNKYEDLLKLLSQTIAKCYPDFKIKDRGIIIKAIANCHNDEGNFKQFLPIIYLLTIVDENNKKLLLETFESELDSNFDDFFYDE